MAFKNQFSPSRILYSMFPNALGIMIELDRQLSAMDLLRAGAEPNIPDDKGNVPLHHAVKNKNLQTIHLLIAFGADVNLMNHAGESPRHLAATDIPTTIEGIMVRSWKFLLPPIYKIYMNSEVIYALHQVGAKRCPPGTKGCQEGCKHGGQYNGMPPNDELDQVDSGPQVYDKYLSDCIEQMCVAAPTKRLKMRIASNASDSVGTTGGTDTTDSAGATSGADGKRPERRSKDTVLCLDGGGIRGLVMTQLLVEMERASGGKRITELFDWIVGTSTGGILAIALSQGYSVEECRSLYMALKNKVFVGGRPYNSEKLEQFLQEAFGVETTMNQHPWPRIMVSGTLCDRSPPALHLFRNYDPPETSSAWIAANQPPFKKVTEPSEQKAWMAARSSCAAPTYFPAMGRFLDGGLIANNPTLDALTEIQEYYMYKKSQGEPERSLGAVVSLGTGMPKLKPIEYVGIMWPYIDLLSTAKSVTGGANLVDILAEQVSESRMRSVDRARAWCFSIDVPFFRFSPPLPKDVALDEKRDHILLCMLFYTQCYIQQNRDKFKQMMDHIVSLEVSN